MANEERSYSAPEKAEGLLEWAKDSTLRNDRNLKGLSSGLYTLSEGGQFEEESISVRSALICHGLIEKLKQAGDLPDEYHL